MQMLEGDCKHGVYALLTSAKQHIGRGRTVFVVLCEPSATQLKPADVHMVHTNRKPVTRRWIRCHIVGIIRLYSRSLDIIGCQLVSLRNRWILWDISGCHWVSLDTVGHHRISWDVIFGHHWISLDIIAHLGFIEDHWTPVDIIGYHWYHWYHRVSSSIIIVKIIGYHRLSSVVIGCHLMY